MLVVDSLRADAPGFGGGEALTPGLDALAASGTVYDEAICSAGWTVPSLNAIATGTFPHRVGVARWRHPFPARRPTVFSAFANAGFEVFSFFHNPRWAFANTQVRGTAGDSQDADAVCAALRAPSGVDRLVFVQELNIGIDRRFDGVGNCMFEAVSGPHVPIQVANDDAVHAQSALFDGLLPMFGIPVRVQSSQELGERKPIEAPRHVHGASVGVGLRTWQGVHGGRELRLTFAQVRICKCSHREWSFDSLETSVKGALPNGTWSPFAPR